MKTKLLTKSGKKDIELLGNFLWIENIAHKIEIRLSIEETIELRDFLNQLELTPNDNER